MNLDFLLFRLIFFGFLGGSEGSGGGGGVSSVGLGDSSSTIRLTPLAFCLASFSAFFFSLFARRDELEGKSYGRVDGIGTNASVSSLSERTLRTQTSASISPLECAVGVPCLVTAS